VVPWDEKERYKPSPERLRREKRYAELAQRFLHACSATGWSNAEIADWVSHQRLSKMELDGIRRHLELRQYDIEDSLLWLKTAKPDRIWT
jgi:hypothetical protein